MFSLVARRGLWRGLWHVHFGHHRIRQETVEPIGVETGFHDRYFFSASADTPEKILELLSFAVAAQNVDDANRNVLVSLRSRVPRSYACEHDQ